MKSIIISFILFLLGSSAYAQKPKTATKPKPIAQVQVKNQIPEYDGVYVEDNAGKYIELKVNKGMKGHYITHSFSSFWNFPVIFFTLENKIGDVSSIKKIILKGAAYGDETTTHFEFFPMEAVMLGGIVYFHSTNGKTMWDTGTAYKQAQTEDGNPVNLEIRKKKVDNNYHEVYLPINLEKQKIYGLWDGSGYVMFKL